MLSVPIEVIIKIKEVERLKDIIREIEEIKEAYPHAVVKPAIEIELRDSAQPSCMTPKTNQYM